MSRLYRVYEEHELGKDGYPEVWHRGVPGECIADAIERLGKDCGLAFGDGVKHLVRAEAGHRCIRCAHPYRVGSSGEWDGAPIHEWRLNDTVVQRELFEEAMAEMAKLPKVHRDDGRGQTNWSDCDAHCTHQGPIRYRVDGGEWQTSTQRVAALLPVVVETQASWRILTVHHLNGNKADLRWWNLCALDQRCHLEIQGKVNMAQLYVQEHSTWFKPHAAGWYAASYLKEDLTREQTMERLDELLGLERMV